MAKILAHILTTTLLLLLPPLAAGEDFNYNYAKSLNPETLTHRNSIWPVRFMASAVLASRNETTWGQSFMGKIPYSNPHRNLNPNPKPNKPNSKKKHFHNNHPINGRQVSTKNGPSSQAASDDAYSFNQTTIQANGNGFNHGGYVSYNVAAYSHTELKELRARLAKELEQIRNLNDRIESGQLANPRSVSNSQGKAKKLSGNKRPVPFGSSNTKPSS